MVLCREERKSLELYSFAAGRKCCYTQWSPFFWCKHLVMFSACHCSMESRFKVHHGRGRGRGDISVLSSVHNLDWTTYFHVFGALKKCFTSLRILSRCLKNCSISSFTGGFVLLYRHSNANSSSLSLSSMTSVFSSEFSVPARTIQSRNKDVLNQRSARIRLQDSKKGLEWGFSDRQCSGRVWGGGGGIYRQAVY